MVAKGDFVQVLSGELKDEIGRVHDISGEVLVTVDFGYRQMLLYRNELKVLGGPENENL